jgi:rfaE bifunctional protein nucleotidyltransferase chain/domain
VEFTPRTDYHLIVTDIWTPSQTKIVPLDRLPACLDPRRAAGERIVLTNGAFDLLHAGHLRSLEEARARGTLLVVGINSDASVWASKAPGRPIVPERDRAALVAGLACVDYVTIFDEPTAERLAEIVRPAVYVKGADYRVKHLPERAVVEAHGGEVVLVELAAGLSTSGLVEQIVRRFGSSPPR